MSQQWKPVCAVADIPVRGARVVRREGKADVAVFRNSEDHVCALLDRCPHKGSPLSQGIVLGDRVACPMHSSATASTSPKARSARRCRKTTGSTVQRRTRCWPRCKQR